jgi:hypothetical protein
MSANTMLTGPSARRSSIAPMPSPAHAPIIVPIAPQATHRHKTVVSHSKLIVPPNSVEMRTSVCGRKRSRIEYEAIANPKQG